jgi:putative FmdB family regulatory protein
MPLYEFRCDTCGDFDAWQTLAELGNPLHCPTCDVSARRLFSAPNVSLNGSFTLKRQEIRDPTLVKRDREPKRQRNQATHGRPWMISH